LGDRSRKGGLQRGEARTEGGVSQKKNRWRGTPEGERAALAKNEGNPKKTVAIEQDWAKSGFNEENAVRSRKRQNDLSV